MGNKPIDTAICAETDERWRKVALIVVRVANSLNVDEEWALKHIAKRLRVLARKGVLELAGNPYNGRASEVRKSSHNNRN